MPSLMKKLDTLLAAAAMAEEGLPATAREMVAQLETAPKPVTPHPGGMVLPPSQPAPQLVR